MQHFSLRAMFCCCSLSWGAFFFLRGLPLCGFPLFSLWKITFEKVAPAYACYFFYTTFSLGRLRFPRKNWEKDCRFCGFPLLSLWKITFSEKLRPLRVLLFLYNFFLRKTSFPTEKLGEGLPLLRLSLALLVENYIFGKATPASRATFFIQLFP